MRTDCIPAKFTCPTSRGAKPGRIEADFSGDAIPSHEGLLLAGPAEGRLGLFARVAACFKDVRRPDSSAPPSDVIRPPSNPVAIRTVRWLQAPGAVLYNVLPRGWASRRMQACALTHICYTFHPCERDLVIDAGEANPFR